MHRNMRPKYMKNFIKKLGTAVILSAFLFNANFNAIEVAFAQYSYENYTEPVDYNNYTNPNTNYVVSGCEYYGNCYNNNPVYNQPTYAYPIYDQPVYNTPDRKSVV